MRWITTDALRISEAMRIVGWVSDYRLSERLLEPSQNGPPGTPSRGPPKSAPRGPGKFPGKFPGPGPGRAGGARGARAGARAPRREPPPGPPKMAHFGPIILFFILETPKMGVPPWDPPPGHPPGAPAPGPGGKKCTFFWVFNNSPSRDSLGPFFQARFWGVVLGDTRGNRRGSVYGTIRRMPYR